MVTRGRPSFYLSAYIEFSYCIQVCHSDNFAKAVESRFFGDPRTYADLILNRVDVYLQVGL